MSEFIYALCALSGTLLTSFLVLHQLLRDKGQAHGIPLCITVKGERR